MIRVLSVEDQQLVAQGIRRILSATGDIEVVGIVQDPARALAAVEELAPDVVLLDIDLGSMNGFDVAARILQHRPATRVVMLSMYVNLEFVLRAHAEGAAGYVLKSDGEEELAAAVRAVHSGRSTCSAGVARLAASLGISFGDSAEMLAKLLSPRELEVVRRVAVGATVGEIADSLEIRPPTVRTLWVRAQRKLGIRAIPLPKYVLRESSAGDEELDDEKEGEGEDAGRATLGPVA